MINCDDFKNFFETIYLLHTTKLLTLKDMKVGLINEEYNV